MNDSDRREYLILHNVRLAIYIAQKYSFEEDYESVALIGLVKAVNAFDLDKGIQFSTYAARVIHNEILMYIRKIKRCPQTISFETVIPGTDEKPLTVKETLSYEDNELMGLEQAELKFEIRKAIHSLPDRECKIICLLYGINEDRCYKQKEVADRFGLSQSYVSRLEKNILKKMKSKLKNYR